MVLPDGVNKAAGLRECLAELKISPAEVAGVGDAENDLSFLRFCGFSAAVANALDQLKTEVDLVLQGGQGDGVEELIETLLAKGVASADSTQTNTATL
jgi:hydroxymethylpyrimidine pyrophosphatase-like HAD family hydrolase